jgi:hypothetical protein
MPQETYTPQALQTKVEELGLPYNDPIVRKACIELTPQARRNAERKIFMQLAKERLEEIALKKALEDLP